MVKHVLYKLKEEWKSISKKKEGDIFSAMFCVIFFCFILIMNALLQDFSIKTLTISLFSICMLFLFLASFLVGNYSADFIYVNKRNEIDYIPIGNLKEESKKERGDMLFTVSKFYVVILVLCIVFSEFHTAFVYISILIVTSFAGYYIGFLKY